MTDKEALDFYKNSHKHNCLELMEADEVAYNALQERIDREKGCECCTKHDALKLGAKVYNQSVSYYIVGDGYPHSEKHRFCPMCGRKLKTAIPGEEV